MKKWMMSALLTIAVASVQAQAPDFSPPPELQKLNWMIGEWSGTVKFTMQGASLDAVSTMKIDWEGKFMKTVMQEEVMGMKISESLYLGWDKDKKDYFAYGFSNLAAKPRVERGTLTGEKLVLISEPWEVELGMNTVSRVTIEKKGETEAYFLMEFKNGEKWDKAGEGTFTRKKKIQW